MDDPLWCRSRQQKFVPCSDANVELAMNSTISSTINSTINNSLTPITIITGATASGKTGLASMIAQKRRVEVISADAFQIYRHMDIGTATPTVAELQRTTHHLINTLDPDEHYSAGRFVAQCEGIIQTMTTADNGNTPLIVGGTAMYIHCLANGMFQEPAEVTNTKGEFYRYHENTPVENLYAQLQQCDPDYAKQITHRDRQKIIRAIHIHQTTGEPFSKAQKTFHQKPRFNYKILVVAPDRELLYKNINERVEKMMQNGWIEEVEALIKMGYRPENAKGFQAIGYADIYNFLQAPNQGDIHNLTTGIATKTRRFAKRQLTWFRNSNLNITTIDGDNGKII